MYYLWDDIGYKRIKSASSEPGLPMENQTARGTFIQHEIQQQQWKKVATDIFHWNNESYL